MQVSRDHNTDGDLRKASSMVEKVMSYRNCYMVDCEKKWFTDHGGRTEWKRNQLRRFDVDEKKIQNEECLFQMAFSSSEVWERLMIVFEMFKAGKIAGMKKEASGKKMTAAKAAAHYVDKKALKQTSFMGLCSLKKEQQMSCLDAVATGRTSLSDMKKLVDQFKEVLDLEKAFCTIGGFRNWQEVTEKVDSKLISEKVLSQFRRPISNYMKLMRGKNKTDDDGNEVVADPTLEKIPKNFRVMVERCVRSAEGGAEERGARADRKGSWAEMTEEDVMAMYNKVQHFDGRSMSNQHKDGTEFCDGMNYKIVFGDSCDRKWVLTSQIMEKAKKRFEEAEEWVEEYFEPMAEFSLKYPGMWRDVDDWDKKYQMLDIGLECS